MKKLIIKISIIAIAVVLLLLLLRYIGTLRTENNRLSCNQAILLDSMSTYKMRDSLNVATINVLELSISDYKKYRAEDAALIKKLKAGKHTETASITTTSTNQITVVLRDTVFMHDTLKCIDYETEWLSVSGYLTEDTANLTITNKESLLVVESLVKKKFLFIKLPVKLFGYKTKRVDVISKNPNTEITNLEIIQIYD